MDQPMETMKDLCLAVMLVDLMGIMLDYRMAMTMVVKKEKLKVEGSGL